MTRPKNAKKTLQQNAEKARQQRLLYINENNNRNRNRNVSVQVSRENSPQPQNQRSNKIDVSTQTKNFLKIQNVVRFVVSVLVLGLSFTVIKKYLNINEEDVCSEKEFYQIQNEIKDVIIEMAKESAQKYANLMEKNAIITLDGAWDHRRHGSCCIVTLIDFKSRKIIDYSIKQKSKQFVIGNSNEPSKNLEKAGVLEIVRRWENSEKVSFYVHDNDGVTRKIIEESNWKITEVLDVGHAVKSIKKNLDNFNKREGKPFNGLVESMGRFLKNLFRDTSISTEIRMNRYKNMGYHYIGNHSYCIHKNLKKYRQYTGKNKTFFLEKVDKFLDENKHYAQKVNPFVNTQNNECFNNLKTKFLPKDKKFSTSAELRLSEAILEWNEDGWIEDLIERLKLDPIRSPYCECLRAQKKKQGKKNEKQRDEEFKKARNAQRNEDLKKKTIEDQKADGYKSNNP